MIRLVTDPVRRRVLRVTVIWGILLALLLAMFVGTGTEMRLRSGFPWL